MNRMQTFEQFLTTSNINIPISTFIINLLIAVLLAFLLAYIYVRYGNSLSNRSLFGRNFYLLTATTMMIITIVKSSLALSLGLVGALSIVRFRAAIKEPEELAYLFFTIGIGLGLGADQRLITIVAFIIIAPIIIIRKRMSSKNEGNQNLNLSISCNEGDKIELEQLIKTLNEYCSVVNLKRFDETKERLEASFLIEFVDFDKLNAIRKSLHGLNNSLKISFLDNKGMI